MGVGVRGWMFGNANANGRLWSAGRVVGGSLCVSLKGGCGSVVGREVASGTNDKERTEAKVRRFDGRS